MEKLTNLFLIGMVCGVLFQTIVNIATLNKALTNQSAIAKTK